MGIVYAARGSAFDDVSPFVYMSPIKTSTETDSFLKTFSNKERLRNDSVPFIFETEKLFRFKNGYVF